MSVTYAKHVSSKSTPQSEPIPGKPMVPNSGGGFAFELGDWGRLDRFLILGGEGPTYYASERKLTVENAAAVLRCAGEDAARAVGRIVEISHAGRAPKNDSAIFALALIAAKGQPAAKATALAAMPEVCRIGTHLFQFAETCQQLRGWGRGLRRAVAKWYTDKAPEDLAYQVLKYQQRNGWSHKDLMHLCHLRGTGLTKDVQHWVEQGWDWVGDEPHPAAAMRRIWAYERLKKSPTPELAARFIRAYGLTREMVPTEVLGKDVWTALLEAMPMTAMVRNLATMTRLGVLEPMSDGTSKVRSDLGNTERLRKSRIHPVAVLAALLTYKAGRGERGQSTWTPLPSIVDALDRAFYASFGNVEPTGKRWLLALDVSGSMSGGTIAGVPGLTPRVASAALALVTAAVEPQHHFVAFTSGGWQCKEAGKGQWSASHGIGNGITPLAISPRQRLDDVVKSVEGLSMGGTDCALPMLYAADKKVPIDVFVVLTDNETWAGNVHPCQALQRYRQKMNIPAKLIVVGMTATDFTIADPSDGGMLDVVGFDTAAPQLMADFARS